MGVRSGPQGSLLLSGLPGWSLSTITSELQICKASWSVGSSSSVVEPWSVISCLVASLYTGPK